MRKRCVPEWGKNLLIVLLSLSALWLVRLSPLYVGSPLESWVEQLSAQEREPAQTALSLAAAAQPLSISIVNENGRYTAQYDSAAVAAAFDALYALLGNALRTADAATPLSESRWQAALLRSGFFLEYSTALPLSVLTEWTGGESAATLLSGSSSRIALVCSQDGTTTQLIWQDAASGSFYCTSTALDPELQLLPAIQSWLPDSSFFAFEDAHYTACDPYTLIGDTLAPQVYFSTTPLSASNSAGVERVLDALSYSVTSGSSYAINGGTRYIDGSNFFQLTNTGELTYHTSDSSPFPISSSHESCTVTECIEATRRLVQATLGQLCGSAELHLSAVEEQGDSLRITYEYRLNGIPISLRQDGWAAEWIVENGFITSFTLHFRSYSPADETTPLLPELQAAAALSALDTDASKLFLTYFDSGASTVSAAWAAH